MISARAVISNWWFNKYRCIIFCSGTTGGTHNADFNYILAQLGMELDNQASLDQDLLHLCRRNHYIRTSALGAGGNGLIQSNPPSTVTEEFTGETSAANITNFSTE